MTLPFAQVSFPELYERELVGPLFRPWAELILDDVHLSQGDRVIDVACGTGIVARLARERVGSSGKVVGVDVSPAMLAVARRAAPAIDWREGDAGALPLHENEEFDVVVCQQGLQFFPDRSAAVREMRRALAPGGRLAVSTWRPDEELPLLRELRRIAERRLGPIDDRRHSFGDAGPLEALLGEAGFVDVRSRLVSRTIRFSDGSAFLRLNAMALVGMSPASKTLGDDERERTTAAIASDSEKVALPGGAGTALTYEIRATVATARAPDGTLGSAV